MKTRVVKDELLEIVERDMSYGLCPTYSIVRTSNLSVEYRLYILKGNKLMLENLVTGKKYRTLSSIGGILGKLQSLDYYVSSSVSGVN